jgi:hypothetical protein
LTGFPGFAYSAEVVSMTKNLMQRTPFYYFAFIYRFSYGEGRPTGVARARESLKS